MALLEKHLYVQPSALPQSGNGLFTRVDIPKGTRIVEYKGKVTTWKDCDHQDGQNGYIYYVKRSYVLDALPYPKALARYANDAVGLSRVKGISNNCEYVEDKDLRVYIQATKDIPAGSEIFVKYGPEYWEVIRYNLNLEKERQKERAAKAAKAAVKAAKEAAKKAAAVARKKAAAEKRAAILAKRKAAAEAKKAALKAKKAGAVARKKAALEAKRAGLQAKRAGGLQAKKAGNVRGASGKTPVKKVA